MINNEIKGKEVRLIGKDGSNEVISKKDAIAKATKEGLDLICINTNGPIPVCKIGDYSKYLYEQKKKEKLAKKKSKESQIETKEIRISASTDVNDLKTKAHQIDKFLQKKNKVRLSIRYRGRELKMISEGAKKLENLSSYLTEDFVIESPAKINGNIVSMTITSK